MADYEPMGDEEFAAWTSQSHPEPLDTSPDAGDGVLLTPLSGVTMRRAKFAWEPRLPLGALTVVAGVPGVAKSHLAVEVAARLTRGQLPGDLSATPVDVVIASAEDALASVLVPRFTAAGADLARVHSVSLHRDGLDLGITIPDDLDSLGVAMRSVGARLLVVDPLLAHIPVRIDGYKDQHVRVALAPLARLAEELDAAVLGIMHLNKRETVDLFSRLGGSGGFLAAARSALLVATDPQDEDVRVAAHGKANLSPTAQALRFRLEGREILNPDPEDPAPIRVAAVVWLGEADLEVSDLLGSNRGTARADAISWLAAELANGPMPEEWVRKAAEDAGHSWATLRRAKADLGVVSERSGFGPGGRWEWTLQSRSE